MKADITVTGLLRCKCGAVTLTFDNNTNTSMKPATLKDILPALKGKHSTGVYYNCNHCVNRWGIDLCNCGSGKHPNKCCGIPAQELATNKPFIGWAR